MPGRLLAGKAVLVAGGSRGIGRAVALALAAHGASVVVNGRSPEAAAEVVARIRETGAKACATSR